MDEKMQVKIWAYALRRGAPAISILNAIKSWQDLYGH